MRTALAGLLLALVVPPQAIADPPPQGQAAAPPRASPAGEPAVSTVAGAYTYKSHCVTCHGVAGKGDGPLAGNLRYHPPDLTLLARRNGGSYPLEKVARIVDGREPLKGHGGPDMPVWGDAFKSADTGYDDRLVREKVRLVSEYLRTLQVK